MNKTTLEALDRSAASLLDLTANYIETNGWMRGYFHQRNVENSPACTVGAMRLVSGLATVNTIPGDLESGVGATEGYHVYRRALSQLKRCIRRDPRYDSFSVIGWNDADEQSAENVVSELRRCAERVRRDGNE